MGLLLPRAQLLIYALALSKEAESLVERVCGLGCLIEVPRLHLLEDRSLDLVNELVIETLREGLILLRVLLGCQQFHALDRLQLVKQFFLKFRFGLVEKLVEDFWELRFEDLEVWDPNH